MAEQKETNQDDRPVAKVKPSNYKPTNAELEFVSTAFR